VAGSSKPAAVGSRVPGVHTSDASPRRLDSIFVVPVGHGDQYFGELADIVAGETQVTLATGPPVWTTFPVAGRVPGAPCILDLSGRPPIEPRIPISGNPICRARNPRNVRVPLRISLGRTTAESNRGGGQRTCECGCSCNFLQIHERSLLRASAATEMGQGLTRGFRKLVCHLSARHEPLEIRYPPGLGVKPLCSARRGGHSVCSACRSRAEVASR
jgi:hypothetical protein